jgi:hypothetical protein
MGIVGAGLVPANVLMGIDENPVAKSNPSSYAENMKCGEGQFYADYQHVLRNCGLDVLP